MAEKLSVSAQCVRHILGAVPCGASARQASRAREAVSAVQGTGTARADGQSVWTG